MVDETGFAKIAFVDERVIKVMGELVSFTILGRVVLRIVSP